MAEFKKGDKVLFNEASDEQVNWGSNSDPRILLKKDTVYIIGKVEMHSWHTKIYLKGIEGKFNSVHFINFYNETIKTKPMSNLLDKRYLRIADFPFMNEDAEFYGETFAIHNRIFHSKNFPSLFRELQWYEFLDEKDFPKHVKVFDDGDDDKWSYFEINEYLQHEFINGEYMGLKYKSHSGGTHRTNVYPATLQEYMKFMKITEKIK